MLEAGGTLRLVLSDLENMAREYLRMREREEHDKSDFVVLEMIDQCVRTQPGGQLGQLYPQLDQRGAEGTNPLINYIRVRIGENLLSKSVSIKVEIESRGYLTQTLMAVRNRIERYRDRLLICLPPAFCTQNVSLTSVGERHQWL